MREGGGGGGRQEGERWWDTGSDLVTLPAAPGVRLRSRGRGTFMLT